MTNLITNPVINGLSHLKNPDATLPTFLIEACCTSGRTYQSYKRGGTLEAKERFREEATCAFFWLWGIKGLNKIGDIIGEKFFDVLTDTGKDELRDPSYLMSNGAKIFKFSKIVSSAVLSMVLLGIIVPKVNHAITAKALNQNKIQKPQENLDEFIMSAKGNKNKYQVNFKGSEKLLNGIMKASYKLENDNKWRLITTDSGMLAGRVYNSRHPAERFEYTFRDILSTVFYNFTTAWIIAGLNKLFKKTDVHPKVVDEICKYLQDKNLTGNQLRESIGTKISENIKRIDFDADGTIKLDKLIQSLTDLGANEEMLRKATLMSQLQPKLRGESILSKAQVEDVFSQSISSDPIFLKNTINAATYGRATNPKKFVSAQTCQSIRESIDDFMLEIADIAKDKNINDCLKTIKKNTLIRTALFQIAGLAFSAFGLAILIPKLQIFLSQKIYGKQSFKDIATGNKKDGKKPS